MATIQHTPVISDSAIKDSGVRHSVHVGVISIVLLCAFAAIGMRPLWAPDEGRYTAVALQMQRSGNWLQPAFNAEQLHFTKPPLYYWSLATSFTLFGENEFAARLPNALAFACTAGLVGLISLRLARGRELASIVIYVTAALPFFASNIVTTDTTLALWTTAAAASFVWGWNRLGTGNTGFDTKWIRLMWAALGVAFLTKGPPGLLVLLAILPAVGWKDGWRSMVRLFVPTGIVAFLVIGLSWFLVVIALEPQLFSYYLEHEVYGRIVTGEHGRHSEWYYAFMYAPLLFAGMLPWSIDWLRTRAWRSFPAWRNDPASGFLALWVTIPLLVFMASSSRLPLYILPLMAPLAIATSKLQSLRWLQSVRAWRAIGLITSVMIGVRISLSFMPTSKDYCTLSETYAIPSGVEEIVFVDKRAEWGLALYTGLEVEEVRLVSDKPIETLASELSDVDANSLVLIIDGESMGEVENELGRHGWRAASTWDADDKLLIHALRDSTVTRTTASTDHESVTIISSFAQKPNLLAKENQQ